MAKSAVLEPRFVAIIASEVGCRPQQVAGRRRAVRRGGDRPLRRPLPQGGHRRPRRGAARDHLTSAASTSSSSTSAATRSWRASRSRASSPPSSSRRSAPPTSKQRARGPLPALQAQAPHPRARSPASGGWSRWPTPCSAAAADAATARGAGRRRSSTPEKGVADARRRSPARATSCAERARRGRRRARASCAASCADRGRAARRACSPARRRTRGRQVPRLLRARRAAAGTSPPTACSPSCAASARGCCALRSAARRRARGRAPAPLRGGDAARAPPAAGRSRAATADGYKRLLRPSIEQRGARRAASERAERAGDRRLRAPTCGTCCSRRPLGQVPVVAARPRPAHRLQAAPWWTPPARVVGDRRIYPSEPHADEAGAARDGRCARSQQARRPRRSRSATAPASRETEAFAREVARRSAGLAKRGRGDRARGRRLASTRPRTWRARSSPTSTSPCAARCRSPAGCRTRSPSWSRSSRSRIGVGQYQHDVDQGAARARSWTRWSRLRQPRSASSSTPRRPPLLRARLRPRPSAGARTIVAHRDTQRRRSARAQALLKVAGFGPRTFEQAAGFLRVRGGENPLDRTAVHPERYAVVERWPRPWACRSGSWSATPTLVGRARLRPLRRRRGAASASSPWRTSAPSCCGPAATRAPSSTPRVARRRDHHQGPQARHGARGAGLERGQLRRLRRHRRPPRRPRPRLRADPPWSPTRARPSRSARSSR